MLPAGSPSGACRTSKRKILRRVSCARAANESTANDVFIFPKQWKYRIIPRTSQMLKTRTHSLHAACDRIPVALPSRSERRWSQVRLSLGLAQMFGAVFSATLLIYTGVSVLALASVIVTVVFTTISILLFGARRSKGRRVVT